MHYGETLMSPGKAIRLLRENSLLSTEQLAEKVRVKTHTVEEWEDGHRRPGMSVLRITSGPLHCVPADILEHDPGRINEILSCENSFRLVSVVERKAEREGWQETLKLINHLCGSEGDFFDDDGFDDDFEDYDFDDDFEEDFGDGDDSIDV